MAQQTVAADENDLKQNRLGLMSQQQLDDLQRHIDYHQRHIRRLMQRTIAAGTVVTIGIIIAVLLRLIVLPVAIVIEVLVVGGMVYMTTDFNRFIQQLLIDKEAQAVRIVKGRTSRYTFRSHPLYQTLRVEVQNYKVLDHALFRQFENGELYQLYVMPQSNTVIAAEKLHETKAGYLN